MESQLKIKQNQVQELENQTGLLRELEPEKEEKIRAKKQIVEERYVKSCFQLFCSLPADVYDAQCKVTD